MPTIKATKVFISATSGDLGTIRKLVKDSLLKIGCMPIEQTDFPPDYRKVADFLAAEISNCDALIHIAGHRYGAEPNPTSLPPGAIRRSYTQLEYDTACRLNKKVYTFLCGENFPYDTCEAEPELKTLLQKTHRETLAGTGVKYERVHNPNDLTDKVRQLRLQLEELARQIQAEHKRQIMAWSIVGGALAALLLVAIVIWQIVSGTKGEVSDTKANTDELIGSTSELKQQGEKTQADVATSLQKVISIDDKVLALLESDLLASIAQQADLQPQQIRQLLSQCKAEEVSVLAYADQLAKQNRAAEAYALTRFVGETALRPENSDFAATARAFFLAAEAKQQLAQVAQDSKERLSQYDQSAAMAERGTDALKTIAKKDRPQYLNLYCDLAMTHGFARYQTSFIVEPRESQGVLEKALSQINGVLDGSYTPVELPNADDGQFAELVKRIGALYRRKAFYLTELANRQSHEQALDSLSQAEQAADHALEILKKLTSVDPEDTAKIYLALAKTHLATSKLVDETKTRQLLSKVAEDCQSGMGHLTKNTNEGMRLEFLLHIAWSKLEYLDVAESESAATSSTDEAIALFEKIRDESRSLKNPYLDRTSSAGLLFANAVKGNGQEMEQAIEGMSQFGFHWPDDFRALTAYVANTSEWTGNLATCRDALKLLNEHRDRYSLAASPQEFGETTLDIARVELTMEKLPRFTLENSKDFGLPEINRRNARLELQNLTKTFSPTRGPRLWARALVTLANLHEAGYGFNNRDESVRLIQEALKVYQQETDPIHWASAQLYLARALAESDPPKLKEAIDCYQAAGTVRTFQNFPGHYFLLNHELSQTHAKIAAAAQDAEKSEAEISALRYAVIASAAYRRQHADESGGYYDSQLTELLTSLKSSRTAEQAAELDDLVTRATAEWNEQHPQEK